MCVLNHSSLVRICCCSCRKFQRNTSFVRSMSRSNRFCCRRFRSCARPSKPPKRRCARRRISPRRYSFILQLPLFLNRGLGRSTCAHTSSVPAGRQYIFIASVRVTYSDAPRSKSSSSSSSSNPSSSSLPRFPPPLAAAAAVAVLWRLLLRSLFPLLQLLLSLLLSLVVAAAGAAFVRPVPLALVRTSSLPCVCVLFGSSPSSFVASCVCCCCVAAFALNSNALSRFLRIRSCCSCVNIECSLASASFSVVFVLVLFCCCRCCVPVLFFSYLCHQCLGGVSSFSRCRRWTTAAAAAVFATVKEQVDAPQGHKVQGELPKRIELSRISASTATASTVRCCRIQNEHSPAVGQ
jgi:hypothetical protein